MNYEDLSDTLTVGDKTITMYAGILSKMDEAIGGFYNVDNITTDKELQTNFVKAIVANYDEEGNVDGYKINVFHMKPSDFDKIFQWGLDHYMVFTKESSWKTLEKLKKMEEELKSLQNNSQVSQNG